MNNVKELYIKEGLTLISLNECDSTYFFILLEKRRDRKEELS